MGKDYKFYTGQQVTLKGGEYSRKGEVVFRFYSIHSIPMYLVEYSVSPTYPKGGTIAYNEKNLGLYKEPSLQYLSADGEILEVGDLVIYQDALKDLSRYWSGRIFQLKNGDSKYPVVWCKRKDHYQWWTHPKDLVLIEKRRR